MGLNRDLVGKHYAPQDYGVTAEATTKYAQAYNEDNPWFLDVSRPGGILAPPMFGVVLGWFPIMLVMTDPELNVDILRLLHTEQDMSFFLPVHPGDIITSTARISSIEEQATGESLALEINSTNQQGKPVQRILFTAFIRGRGRRERGRERLQGFPEEPHSQNPLFRVSQSIDTDQTYRYAEASGDHNPIHTDENTAKMAGLPGIIVHGLCTMAFASKVMLDHVCDRDPRQLKRLRACFSRPVFPGQKVTTAVWLQQDQGDLKVYTYETYNPEGNTVIREGIAEVGKA